MSADRARLGRLLVAAVSEPGTAARDRLPALAAGAGSAGVAAAASAHRVSNAVYQALVPVEGVDGAELAALEREYQQSLRRHLRALVDLAAVEDVLGAHVPWLAVKGPVLSERLYGPSCPRNYADLDVVVPRAAFREAVERCVDAGLPIVGTDWAVAADELAGELCVILPSGTAMDLHWALQYHARARARFPVPVDEMIGRAEVVDLAGTKIRTFDPADTLLHLCLHAATGGGGRLQWVKDVERAVTVGRPDWDAVVSRARAGGLALVAGVMLDRARILLAAPVPREVTAALGAPGWRALVRATTRLQPIERTGGRSAVSTMVVRATAGTTGASVRGLARQLRAAARRPGPPPTHVDLRQNHDPGLDRFLDAVSGPAPPREVHR